MSMNPTTSNKAKRQQPETHGAPAPRLPRGWGCLGCIFLWAVFMVFATPAQADFLSDYARGKLLLKQKLYVDAAKIFNHAIQSNTQGKQHFGAHYFLALAHYRLIHIERSSLTFTKALALSKNAQQRKAATKMLRQIQLLFGKINITPSVDPDEVGRLRLQLQSKAAFSHPQKRRVYRILQKRWATQGLQLNQTTYYLPRGSYSLSIRKHQCLRYGFTQQNKLIRTLEIGASTQQLALESKQSCQCTGGQIRQQTAKQFRCACPPNTAWSNKTKRCEIPTSQRSWIATHWPWVTAIGVGVVGGGIALTYFLATSADQRPPIPVSGQLFKK